MLFKIALLFIFLTCLLCLFSTLLLVCACVFLQFSFISTSVHQVNSILEYVELETAYNPSFSFECFLFPMSSLPLLCYFRVHFLLSLYSEQSKWPHTSGGIPMTQSYENSFLFST